MSNYVVGHNMPGYLPESEPWITHDWESARESLIGDLERHADSESQLLGSPDMVEVGQIEETVKTIDAAIEELRTLRPGSEWGATIDNTAYWLSVTDEEPEDEDPGFNYPTLYVDGESKPYEDDLERVQIEFDATANGAQSDADERAPLGWCNSAAITLDREDDAVHVTISTGDPRGAFAMTIRRIVGDNGEVRLIMHTPHPSDSMLHEPLKELRPGTYEVGVS